MGHATDPQPQAPTQSLGALFIAASMAHHLAHCTPCREMTEQDTARYAAYGASIARRDRRQLGLHLKATA